MNARVINRKYIVPEVLELTLEVREELSIIPGQRALFALADKESFLDRIYSIADRDVDEGSTLLIFVIKMTGGRGTTLIDTLKIGETVNIKGIYGHFALQKTDAPKVFIGTGTGLAPLINMASHCECKDKTLIYSVPFFRNLFYEEKIKKIPDLKYEFHITREEVKGYEFGRFDAKKRHFPPESEFYICGNPKVVEEIIQELQELGYKHIFSEKFG